MIHFGRRLGTLLLTAAVLAACGGEPEPTPAPPSTPAGSPAPATPSPTPSAETGPPALAAVEVNDLGKLCGAADHRATPARPYAGAGPHPIVVFSTETGQRGYERDYLVNRDGAEFDPQEPAEVALLACVTGAKAGKRVGNCRYDTSSGARTVRVDAQRFTIDIFALDTGRRVGRETFQADFCPPGLLTSDGGADIPKQMYSTMTIDDRAKVLDPYVKGAA